MSLDFDGTNDVVTLASTTLGDTRSIIAWIRPDTQGESDAGRVFNHGSDAIGRSVLRWNTTAASKKLSFGSGRATNGLWEMTTGFTTLVDWHFVAVIYDGSATTNDPTMYVSEGNTLSTLTVGSGLTETSTPVGAEDADGGTLFVGSTDAAGATAYDGLIGEFSAWASQLLTAEEVAAIFAVGPLAIPGAYVYWPMDDTGTAHATDLSGNARTGSITGAVVGANPPARPAGRRG